MTALYPEALKHPWSLIDVLWFMAFWLPFAAVGYCLAVCALMIPAEKRQPHSAVFKAALIPGLCVFLLLPLYRLPFHLMGQGDHAALVGFFLVALALIASIIAAIRQVRRTTAPNAAFHPN